MNEKVSTAELTGLLLRIARGETTVAYVGAYSWAETYAGNVEFITSDGWKLVVFNDCDEFDYVSEAIAPDGREYDFDHGYDIGYSEEEALGKEFVAVERVFEEAKPTNEGADHGE